MLTIPDIQRLDRQTVLVRTTADTHNPPVGIRGWVRVVDGGDASREPKVEVVLEYPDMFDQPAHERIIELRPEGLEQLLASEKSGAYEITVDIPLEH